MSKPDPDLLREVPQQFDLTGVAAPGKGLAAPRRVKVFKSGNSLAVRMPKGLGLEAGMELELVSGAEGALELRKLQPPKRKIDISGFAGKAPWLKPLPPELREFEERPSTIAARKKAEDQG